jgi:hypothetical protein
VATKRAYAAFSARVRILLYLDGVKKVLADRGFPQFGGRASEEGGELAAVGEVMACGGGAEVAGGEVLGHAVVKWSQGLLLVKEEKRVDQEVKDTAAPPDAGGGRRPQLIGRDWTPSTAAASASFNIGATFSPLGLGHHAPEPRSVEPPERSWGVAESMVGGLHHRYRRCA